MTIAFQALAFNIAVPFFDLTNADLVNLAFYQVMAFGLFYFSALYLGGALLTLALTKHVLPRLQHGSVLDPRPLPAGQRAREWRQSALSIFIFGTGLVAPWLVLKWGWSRVAEDASGARIVAEIVVLTLWNEVHFYLCHRLLHTDRLKRFHLDHHRSVITTPWATFSFHPLEAALLGSVIVPPMLVHHFSLTSLLMLPVISILFNNIGHSNYDFLPGAAHDRWWLNGARRHHMHHVRYKGNFGFMLPFMDRWLRTDLKNEPRP
ncbi:sterol desaturase family protein [Ottowia thiooxydans]|uniref:sterol desaturase family protein n=1 Tax=Ottowia thiooxydans TaxID=219182 RepID=UPI00041DA7E9|nr:sterol desaturase family protein [Ottowia thiooxydans]